MTNEELEAKIKILEDKLAAVEDIQQIEKLQRAYGYYLDNRLFDQVVDLFSENTESLEISDSGVYLGKAGVSRFFKDFWGKVVCRLIRWLWVFICNFKEWLIWALKRTLPEVDGNVLCYWLPH